MAELSTHSGANNSGEKVRAKKRSTRIDMTPMVDLAFLLLTFFILTTTFNKPSVLQLTMPEATSDRAEVNINNVLNLVLAENNKLYWWMEPDPKGELTNYSQDGVRRILLERSRANPKLMVLIKVKDKARYENVVDILDEMEITSISRYALVEFTKEDKAKIGAAR